MDISGGFRQLAAVVESLEADGVEVHDVSIADEEPAVTDGRLRVSVDVSVPAASATGGEGTVAELNEQDDPTDTGNPTDREEPVESAPSDGADDDVHRSDGGAQTADPATASVACTHPDCDQTFDSEPGMKVHRTKVHGGEADEGEPAYRDPERLREAYEAHDSFPAMRDALGVSVSAQTVRRHAIKHGIHDQEVDSEVDTDDEFEADDEVETEDGTSANTTPDETGDESKTADGSSLEASEGSDSPADAEDDPAMPDEDALIADGSSLADAVPEGVSVPDGITLRELRAGVKTADTLYDVQKEFGTDRETARDLLSAFDLLDLVHGRVATKRERDERKSEVDRRIRRSLENGAS